jgi:hypothetical protein
MADLKVLELIAVPADGWETQFDGMPLAPGVHLRWSFWPELGWPSGGFEIKRRSWYEGEFEDRHPEPDWQMAAAFAAPPAASGVAAAMRAARTVTSGVVAATLEQHAASLVRLVQDSRATPPRPLRGMRGSQPIEIPSMQAVMLAAIDPYAARALGLAFIDGKIAPRTPVDYQAFGYWGAIPVPWHGTTFQTASPADLATGLFDGDLTRLSTGRGASLVTTAAGQTALQLVGVADLALSVELMQPARELEIELDGPTAATAAARWRVTGMSGARSLVVGGGGLTVTAAGATLRILTPESFPVDQLEIRDTTAASTTWRIIRLRHRRAPGNIATQASRIVRISPPSGSDPVPAESISVAWPPPLVATPAFARTSSQPAASQLGDDGRVKLDAFQVDAFLARPPAPPEDRPELARPVRLHVGHIRAAGGGAPARSEFPTLPMPLPGPSLAHVASWRLDGSLAGVGAGPALVARGTVRYAANRFAWTPSRRLDMQRPTLYLTGRSDSRDAGGAPGYLEANGIAALDAIGSELHLQLWVMPIEDAEPTPTLIGHNQGSSFRLALFKLGTFYRVRLHLHEATLDSNGTIPQGAWSHVAAHYDGQSVRFYVNGVLDLTRAAALGPVRANPERKLYIGCDPITGGMVGTVPVLPQPFAYPFAGLMADVQIRRGAETTFASHHLLAGWPLDGDLRERKSGVVAGTIGTARFVVDHPESVVRRAAQLDGTWCAVAPANRVADPGRRLCLKVRIKPGAGQTAPVIAGARGWKLSLQIDPAGYRVKIAVGARSAVSTTVIAAERWAEVIVGVDGEHASLYLNGAAAGWVELPYGRVPGDPGGSVTIGADPASRSAALVAPYRGLIADLDAGDTLPGAASPQFLVEPPAPPAEPAGDLTARGLEPGLYRLAVQGVDLFGRVGGLVASGSFTLPDDATPPRPGGARARFLPLLGEVTEATRPSKAAPSWSIRVRLTRPASIAATVAARLLRHDVELAQVAPGTDGRLAIERAQTWEIADATPTAEGLDLRLTSPPLPRLLPAAGQRVSIAHDLWVRTEWTWTGTQRLLAPRVDRFRLTERRWQAATSDWPTTWSPLASAAVAHGDLVAYDEAAPALACVPVSHADWATLREDPRPEDGPSSPHRGVKSIPEPFDPDAPAGPPRRRRPRARLWKLQLPVTTPLAGAPSRLDPAGLAPDDFVAGALVAYNAATEIQAWQLFTVHWHHWTAASGWTLYLVENSRGGDATAGPTPLLAQVRYYPGQRYRVDAALSPPLSLPAAVATQAIEIAVAALDTAGRASPVETSADARSGGAADVVAVNRLRPALPPRPTVVIDRADYYGKSRATVSWTPEPETGYHVFRATDNAVISRDVELRRAGQGIYERPEAERVSDDPDFETWLAAGWPDWVPGWRARLFVRRPADETDGAAMAAWEAANAVWRAWAARFYGALPATSADPLDPMTLQAIAGRPGVEEAFALVNGKPVDGGSFADTVPGAVRNRYLYRLRSQSAALVRGTEYGPVSAPVAAPSTRPPATPVLTRVAAGDRSVALAWVAGSEPALREYRIYRGRTRGELEDLRWWAPGVDGGMFVVAAGGAPEYVDGGLEPRAHYFYRLVAVDAAGNHSVGSTISAATPFDGGAPPEPEWIRVAWNAGTPEVVLEWRFPAAGRQQVQCRLEKRGGPTGAWLTASGWMAAAASDAWSFRDTRINPAATALRYRLKVATVSGQQAVFEAPAPERTG